MSQEVISGFYNSDGKRNYSIAGIVDKFDGESLSIAIVSEELSASDVVDQHLTEAASDAIIAYIQNSSEENYSKLLYHAVSYANKVIYEQYASVGRSCTLAVAIINRERKAYIANVGNSRIYLARRSKLSQLSLNHTVVNLMPIQEKLMLNHDSVEFAQDLYISIGSQPSVPVDIGFHFPEVSCKEEYLEAQARGKLGLPLGEGDSIVLSSQEIHPKQRDQRKMVAYSKKITSTLLGKRGDQAAKSLSLLSLMRDPVSNPSIAVLQLPFPPKTTNIWMVRKILNRYSGAVAGALMTLLIFLSLTVSSITVMAWNQANNNLSPQFSGSSSSKTADTGSPSNGRGELNLQNSRLENFDLGLRPMEKMVEEPAIVSEERPALASFTRIEKVIPKPTVTESTIEYKVMAELFPHYGVATIEILESNPKNSLGRTVSRSADEDVAVPEAEREQRLLDMTPTLSDPLALSNTFETATLEDTATSDQKIKFDGTEQREVAVRLNLRLGPSTDREIIGVLVPGELFEAYYRITDETGDIWLLGRSAESGEIGWVWGHGTEGGEFEKIAEFLPID